MKITKILLLLAVFPCTSVSAGAQEAKDRRPPPHRLQIALDENADRDLSADEIANASNALLKLDKNGDGALTHKELAPKPPKPPKGKEAPHEPPFKKGRPSPLMKALDLDLDGTLSAEEIEASSGSLLILDKNSDGTISRKELTPGKPPRKEV
jgi:hypothetical protein